MKVLLSNFRRCGHIAMFLLATSGFVAGQNVINGSFEDGVDPGVSETLLSPDTQTITGWNLEGGSVDYIGTRWMAGDGNRSLDMTGISAGILSQSISGFTVGVKYRLSFLLAANTEGGAIVKRLQASIGSATEVYAFDGTGLSGMNMGWTPATLDFVATNATLVLSFQSLHEGLYGPALDKVVITPMSSVPPTLTIRSCVEICWPSQPGVRYQLQRSPNPNSSHWVNIGQPVAGTGDTVCVNDCDRGVIQRIYRLVVVP